MRKSTRSATWALGLVALLALAPAATATAAGTGPVGGGRRPPPAVRARAATLYDPAARSLLWSARPDLELPVASLTKLMTAWLALQQPATTAVKAGGDLAGIPQTTAGLVPGRTYTLGGLLPVLIVRSANDAAVAIADALGGSVPGFVTRMNAAAAAMGLSDTHYVNPNGLDAAGQHSSARDVAVLAGVDMAIPAFRQLAALRTATLPGGATFTDENPFLGAYPGADGVKTGFTSTAGFCLAASATRGGRLLIAVVLGEPSWSRAVADASALLNWGFAQAPAKLSGDRGAGPAPAVQGTAAAATPSPPAGTGQATKAGAGSQSVAQAGTATAAPVSSGSRPVAPAQHLALARAAPAVSTRPSAGAGAARPPSPVPPAPVHNTPAAWLALAAVALFALGASVARRRGG